MYLRTTDEAYGVSIANNSEMVVASAGVYNVQFSAQLYNSGGGGSGTSKTVVTYVQLNGISYSIATASGAQGWSTVVWDLLAYGTAHAFTRAKRAKLVKHPRSVSAFVHAGAPGPNASGFLTALYGSGKGVQLAAWLESGAEGPPPQFDGYTDDEDGPGGVGLVVIETSEGIADRR
mgnify:CR=1 FL=1